MKRKSLKPLTGLSIKGYRATGLLPLAFQLADLGSHVILEVIAQEVHRAPDRKCDLVDAKILRAMMDVTKDPEIVLVVVNPVQDLFLTEVLLVLAAVGVPLPEVREQVPVELLNTNCVG